MRGSTVPAPVVSPLPPPREDESRVGDCWIVRSRTPTVMSIEEDLGSRKPRFWDGGLVAKRITDSVIKMTAGAGMGFVD